MSDEKRRVLEMLEAGTITPEDASRLLEALGEGPMEAGNGGETEKPQTEEQPPVTTEVPSLTLHPEMDANKINEVVTKLENQAAEVAAKAGKISESIAGTVEKVVTDLFGGAKQEAPPVPPVPPAPPAPSPTPAPSAELAPLPKDGMPYGGEAPGWLDQPVECLRIRWVNGPVEVRIGESDQLLITEYSKRPLEDNERMIVTVEDGEVEIKWGKKQGGLGWLKNNVALTKHLVVELPRSQSPLEEMEVSCVSGDIYLQGLTGDGLSANNVSGSIYAAGLHGDDLNLNTVSGRIIARDLTADDLDVGSVSGAVEVEGFRADDATLKSVSGRVTAWGTAEDVHGSTTSGAVELRMEAMPGDLSLNSVSGRLTLTVPDAAFNVHYQTNSGSFSSGFPLSGRLDRRSGDACYGEGDAELHFHTVSGGMTIQCG